MTEHSVLTERVKALETMLIDAGILSRDALESFEPDDAQEAAWSQARFQLIKDVLESGANITEK
jgi:negative regulator of sigma E activity